VNGRFKGSSGQPFLTFVIVQQSQVVVGAHGQLYKGSTEELSRDNAVTAENVNVGDILVSLTGYQTLNGVNNDFGQFLYFGQMSFGMTNESLVEENDGFHQRVTAAVCKLRFLVTEAVGKFNHRF
jgi:hypothetical protein